jgi:Ulp1 family protease
MLEISSVVEIGIINVFLQSLMCLANKVWLNDEVIDALKILVTEFQRTKKVLSGEK